MNARDSEKLTGILEASGFTETDTEEADFVLYNTCTVRDNANQRVYGRLGYLNRIKQKNPNMMIDRNSGFLHCFFSPLFQQLGNISPSFRWSQHWQ